MKQISRARMVLVCWFVLASLNQARLQAQDNDPGLAALQQCDARLNAAYSQIMAVLPPVRREHLRTAERAWIAFHDKNDATLQTLVDAHKLTLQQVRGIQMQDINARANEIRMMVAHPNIDPGILSQGFQHADANLNETYQRCVAVLDPAALQSLRQVQRLWIVFRDQDGRANEVEDLPGKPSFTGSNITFQRLMQLQNTYLSPRPSVVQVAPQDNATPDPSIPDPYATAR